VVCQLEAIKQVFLNSTGPDIYHMVSGQGSTETQQSILLLHAGCGAFRSQFYYLPGRVVWVWDANATDETCTNEPGDYWFQDDNVDAANWAEGIVYDPEADGILIPSLGVHEHWNNDIEKKYTRDLGTGDGIELLRYLITDISEETAMNDLLIRAYPNPFTEHLTFEYVLGSAAEVQLVIYGPDGKRLNSFNNKHASSGTFNIQWNGGGLPAGIYLYDLKIIEEKGNDRVRGKAVKSD